jgi:DNA polymerase III sliding clamp (beta) subunit (PCNA family)
VSKAKFYVATLAAAVERAARIAPNKGAAFDKAAGIVLEVDPEAQSAWLRATDLDVMYREEVRDVADYGDDRVTWRLPSTLFAGILAGLPLDKEVTIKDDGERRVRIFCGKKQAKLRTMPTDLYPEWPRVEADGLQEVPAFSQRVSQVAWAVDKDRVPLVGVNIDGVNLNATDGYRMARVPCPVPLEEPVTVALSTLAPILKNLPGEVSLAATSETLLMRVGEEIEAICALFAKKYPDIQQAIDKRGEFSLNVRVHRQALYDAMNSMLVLVKNERYPRMNFEFVEGSIALFMTVPETGDMTDVVDAEFDDNDASLSIDFTPEYLLKALDGCSSEYVKLSLGPSNRAMVRVKDDDYVAYVMPLADVAKKDDK